MALTHSIRLCLLGILAGLAGLIVVPAYAGTSLRVSAQANIFGAGHLPPYDTPNPSGGSGGIPPVVFAFPPDQFRALTFTNVNGMVKMGNPTAPCGPDGGNFGYKITSYNGIAGIDAHVTGYLTGVFLGAAEPTDPAPAALNFSIIGTNFSTLSPQIGQVFFIGDGLTDTGTVQEFIIPPKATRLFLGLADAAYYNGGPGYYHDNTGEFDVTVEAQLNPSSSSNLTEKTLASITTNATVTSPAYTAAANAIALPKDNLFGYALPERLTLSQTIEASSDLIHWLPATNVSFYFKDKDSTNFNQRFYRFGTP